MLNISFIEIFYASKYLFFQACFIENEADIKTYLDSKTEEKRLKLELVTF